MDATEIVMLGIGVVALVWELLAMASRRGWIAWRLRLISPVMRDDGRIWLAWPWLLGVLCSHWWFPVAAPEGAWGWLIVTSVLLVSVDLMLRKGAPRWLPFAAFVVGAVVSALTWAMGY